jgi:acyl carrier protein|tara:strand:- start:898 stop:1182 length:285 start_codon:yes stop_codon:yes gene_type:complete
MYDLKEVEERVFKEIQNVSEDKRAIVDKTTPLIGGEGTIDSVDLVDMCLELEDFAVELGFEFDWASEKAMSATNSIFKDAGSLSKEFIRQWKEN